MEIFFSNFPMDGSIGNNSVHHPDYRKILNNQNNFYSYSINLFIGNNNKNYLYIKR